MKLLLIDDNKDITEAISVFLDGQSISCDVKNDGKQGLDAIKTSEYDLVLLDIAMPEFSGYDIISELEKDGLMSKINIVIITASSLGEDKTNNLLKKGVKQIIKKPMSLETLQVVIDRFKT